MARDFEALYKAQAESKAAVTKNETISLPPGYLVGFDVRLRPDYTVLITAGACNIGGRLVQLDQDHQLADEDWIAPKINSTRHYYIYLSAAGQWFVDIVAPVWNNKYLYYEQPDTNWRAVGKIFLADGQIIFGIKEVEKNEQTVTVAPAGFTGRADYYCIHDSPYGENDQILINAAIRYLHEAYDGGEATLLQGSYAISDSVICNYSNIKIKGTGIGTVIQNELGANTVGISVYGTSGSNISDVQLSGLSLYSTGNIQHDDIKFNYVSRGVIKDVVAQSASRNIFINNSTHIHISGCIITSAQTSSTSTQIAVDIQNSTHCIVSNISAYGFANTYSGCVGVSLSDVDDSIIESNVIYNFTTSAAAPVAGIALYQSDRNIINGNAISSMKETGAGSAAYGIYIDSLTYYNKISGNYCYNNGSDTGIANTNSNNFYDGGTDTQVYSNSWQQPVAGEPSCGTPKYLATRPDSWDGSMQSTTFATYTCTRIPAGSLAVILQVAHSGTGGSRWRKTGSGWSGDVAGRRRGHSAAGITEYLEVTVPVNSSLQFDCCCAVYGAPNTLYWSEMGYLS